MMHRDPSECDILIKGAHLLTMDERQTIYPTGAVVVRGNSIAEVGPEDKVVPKWRAKEVIDAYGAIVHPGFIDAHLHITANLSRGRFLGDASKGAPTHPNFADWKAALNSEEEKLATLLGGLELLRHGFTTFVEPGSAFDPDAIAEAARTLGIRCSLADPYLWDDISLMDLIGGLKSEALFARVPPNSARAMLSLGQQLYRNQEPNDIVHGHVALYGEGTASDELLQAAKKAADNAGTILNLHLGFDIDLALAMEMRWRTSRFEHLAELGVLGQNVTLVHMNVITDRDVRLLLAHKPSLIWCPLSYHSRGLGRRMLTRLPELMRAGFNVALGTDSARNCTVGDAGFLAYHTASAVGAPLSCYEILSMLTNTAATAAGLFQVGSIAPGKRADIVIRDDNAIEMQPRCEPISQIIAVAHGPSAATVLVNGRVVLRDGESTLVDEKEVAALARGAAVKIAQRVGLAA